MIPVSPAFSPLHSFAGGLMLASGVHAMLRQMGMVLGISGFFHMNVKNMLSISDISASSSASNGNVDPQSIHHRISPEDDEDIQSELANAFVSQFFVHGLLAGGAILAASRVSLESALGAPIFDKDNVGFRIGKGLSGGIFSLEAARRFVPVACFGALVGFGTKLGSGCTSGHFLCGLSRFSLRSFVATCTFFGVAVLTNVLSHPVASVPSRKLTLAMTPQMPSLVAVGLLQLPAVAYLILVPLLTHQRNAGSRAGKTDELKSVHEQAAKASSFLIGLHFAFGLALTGMTRPSKVSGFLNLSRSHFEARQWDPSLAFVALGGITMSSLSWFFSIKPRVQRRKAGQTDASARPLFWRVSPRWRIPTRTSIDWRLVLGAVLFGIGWGATGLCPGPALVGFGASTLPAPQDKDALLALAYRGTFVGAIGAGGLLAGAI
jgi:hypothetical protein